MLLMILEYGALIALLVGCGIFFFLTLREYLLDRKYSPPVERLVVNRLRLASVCLPLSLLMTVGAFIDLSQITMLVLGFAVVPFVCVMRFFIRLFEYREYHVDLSKVVISGVAALVVSVAIMWVPVGVAGSLLRFW